MTTSKFAFDDQPIRVATIDDEPWFSAVDVGKLLFGHESVVRKGIKRYMAGMRQDEYRVVRRQSLISLGLIEGNERGYARTSVSVSWRPR